MKNETLFRAIGEVGDDLIQRADQPVLISRTAWVKWAALAACCALVIWVGSFALQGAGSKSTGSMAAADSTAVAETTTEAAPNFAMESAAAPAAEEGTEDAAAPREPEEGIGVAYSIEFDGNVYFKAAANDGAHTAGESDGDLAGELLGTVEACGDESFVGDEIYAYGGFSANQYVLVLHDGSYLLFEYGGSALGQE